MCFSPQRRAFFRHQNSQKQSRNEVFCTFSLPNVCFATAAYHFSTSELPKVLSEWGVLYIFTSKCVFRHSGVQFLISPLTTWLRTRRFNRPTFGLTRHTNHWKNTAFRDFANIWTHDRHGVWSDDPMIRWSDGPMVRWSDDPMIRWSADPMIRWSDGPMVRWSADPMIRWSADPMIRWSADPMIRWSADPMIRWSADPTIRWSDDPLQFRWSDDPLIRCDPMIRWSADRSDGPMIRDPEIQAWASMAVPFWLWLSAHISLASESTASSKVFVQNLFWLEIQYK